MNMSFSPLLFKKHTNMRIHFFSSQRIHYGLGYLATTLTKMLLKCWLKSENLLMTENIPKLQQQLSNCQDLSVKYVTVYKLI